MALNVTCEENVKKYFNIRLLISLTPLMLCVGFLFYNELYMGIFYGFCIYFSFFFGRYHFRKEIKERADTILSRYQKLGSDQGEGFFALESFRNLYLVSQKESDSYIDNMHKKCEEIVEKYQNQNRVFH